MNEDFDQNEEGSAERWTSKLGGDAIDPCRVLSAGKAFHMTGPCSRILETADLDLTSAVYIQFYFMFGCSSLPSSRAQGVFLYYSTNGGITWHLLKELHYSSYRMPG